MAVFWLALHLATSIVEEDMDDEILSKVRAAFSNAFKTPPELVTIDSTPEQISGWDSLGHVALGGELEKVFSLSFDVDDLMEMEDVRSIIRVVQAKLK